MEKDFKCKSRGLRSLICYTSIKLENKVLSLHSILNQKDMPESNIFSYKGDNIKLFKNQKKVFSLCPFCYRKHFNYVCNHGPND